MTFAFDKQVVARGGNALAQWNEVVAHRRWWVANERRFAADMGAEYSAAPLLGLADGSPVYKGSGITANANATKAGDAWLDFDGTTKKVMYGDDGDVILSDLLPLAKSVNIGKVAAEYAKWSISGSGSTSINGRMSKIVDNPLREYDGQVVAICEEPFHIDWREREALRYEGIDDLADRQAEAVRRLRVRTANLMLDGDSTLNFKGYGAMGLLTHSNVGTYDMTVDLTAAATSYAQIEAVFLAILKQARVTNKVTSPLTVYISEEIRFNLMRRGSNDGGYRTFMAVLQELPGIAAIKSTNRLSGNRMLFLPLVTDWIQPVVGMAASVVPVPRHGPFDPINFVAWGAFGILIKTDSAGNKGAIYARPAP